MRHVLPPIVAIALLGGCVPAARPPVSVLAQPPRVALPAPRQTLGSDWRDWPVTPGDWRYVRGDAGRSDATFGAGANGYRLQLACDARTRQVTLAIPAAPGAPVLTIRTSTTTRNLQPVSVAHADAWPPITSDVRLVATDPLLDAIAFSRGHFTVEEPGRPPLVIPAWAEIGRVIEDCRG